MSQLFKKLLLLFIPLLMVCCTEDKYNKIYDLFQPRFVLDEPEVKGNSISIVWYEVNDAVSYTVEYYLDQYHTNLFMKWDTFEPQLFVDDIPYGTTYYIRVRSNADNPENNSQWAYTSATTEKRPQYNSILEDVSKSEITETTAIVRWKKNYDIDPVDSISVMPMVDKTLPGISRYLTIAEMMQGYAVVEGLTKNTLYTVNIYDTNKPRQYDKPYNQVTLRTAGPSAASIQVGPDDDLSAMLLANDLDPEIPEGTEYYLPAGSSYRVTPFSLAKGFRIVGSSEGVKPKIIMNYWWNVAEGSYIESLEFENVEIQHSENNLYFMNADKAYTIENVSFVNCDFIGLTRGFWRHQGANSKHIMNFAVEGCRFDKCGWQTSCYGLVDMRSFSGSTSFDQVDNASFKNCTFSRDNNVGTAGYGWGNLFYAPYIDKPIKLEFKNITVYDYCLNKRMINIGSAVDSELTIEGMVLASPSGDLYVVGANTKTNFSNNYTTKDYALGGAKMNATDLDVTADDLFADPKNGDLTINDAASPIVTNRAGDIRWIP